MANSSDTGWSAGSMLRNIPVGRKLLLGFGAVGLVVLALAASQFVTIQRLTEAAREITNRSAPTAAAADEVRFAAAAMTAAQASYVVSGDPEGRVAYEAAANDFDNAVDHLRALADSAGEKALVAKIASGGRTFANIDQVIWTSLQSGDRPLAANLMLGPEALDAAGIASDANRFQEIAAGQQADAAARFEATVSTARRSVILLSLVAILLVVICSVVIGRAIRRPLKRVQEAAERAAAGDLAGEVDVQGEDESGRLAAAFNTMLVNLRNREEQLVGETERQELEGRLHRALENADSEMEAAAAVERAMVEFTPSLAVELMVADEGSSEVRVAAATAGGDGAVPGCPLRNTNKCPAIRSGRTLVYRSSEQLDACPQLRDRPQGPVSAACVPVTFMGQTLGVLHATGEVGHEPNDEDQAGLRSMANQAGGRVGMIRSMERTTQQASTDTLTGLMNRRAVDERVRDLTRRRTPFALVMGDLDFFKMLNDTHGHAAGDSALQTWAQVALEVTGHADLVARWGGEEFLLVLEGSNSDDAEVTVRRIGERLSERLAATGSPPFTASYGIAESSQSNEFEELLRLADVALYMAKEAGRDRAVVATTGANNPRVEPHGPAPSQRVATASPAT